MVTMAKVCACGKPFWMQCNCGAWLCSRRCWLAHLPKCPIWTGKAVR